MIKPVFKGLPAKNALSVAASIARGQAPADVCAISVAGDRGLLEHPVTTAGNIMGVKK